MNKKTHKTAALKHYEIAENVDQTLKNIKDEDEKTANMTVAAQNYFYAGINAIEAIFAVKDLHSFSHENRYSKVTENPGIISSKLYSLFNEVDRDVRNKVGYRGKNGSMYKKIKEFSKLAVEEMNNG